MSEGFACPSCGEDWRGPAKAPAGAGAPAHLAVLEAGASRAPKKRLVSTAGPAVPVVPKQDDSVPSGWMARLEAARAVAKGGDHPAPPAARAGPTSEAPQAAPPSSPPPLERALARRGSQAEGEGKPAHLLVAQLEADEQRRRDQEAARRSELFSDEEPEELISKVEVELPKAPPRKKRVPDWLIVVVLGAVVLGGIGYAYTSANDEPAPKAEIDPELAKKAELRKQAMVALERGHMLALEGKQSADAAIAAYEEALALEPTLASAERGIAIVYAAKDDDANAVAHYKRYLELSPDAKDAAEVEAIIERWERAKKQRGR